ANSAQAAAAAGRGSRTARSRKQAPMRSYSARSGFGQLKDLTRVDALRVLDLREIGRIDDQITGAGPIGAAGDLPEAVAGPHDIILTRRQLHPSRLRQRESEPLRDMSGFPGPSEPHLPWPPTHRTGPY